MTEPVARSGPLAGIRVLDLTRLLPGPVATMHLADLGAEVIKIEDTGPGDYARAMGPGERATVGKGGDSVFFRMVNRNKKSLRLDLKQAAGVAAFLRLAKDADVIFESFRPGVVDKLGIGYEAVKAINPRIVYCAITGYGQTGPWAEHAGHDINYLATSGLLDQIGSHDGEKSGPPAIPNLQVGDLLGGALTPLLGVLAAVIGARATGQGSHVDVAMTDAVLAHNIFPLVTTQVFGNPAPRGADLLTGGVPCYGVFRTADDRYLAVGALEPKFWQGFCQAIGVTQYAIRQTEQSDRQSKETIRTIIAGRTLAEWVSIFAELDVCVEPVLSVGEAVAHPQAQARQMIVPVPKPDGTTQLQTANPIKFSSAQPRYRHIGASLGADTLSILHEIGYTDNEVRDLQQANVFGAVEVASQVQD